VSAATRTCSHVRVHLYLHGISHYIVAIEHVDNLVSCAPSVVCVLALPIRILDSAPAKNCRITLRVHRTCMFGRSAGGVRLLHTLGVRLSESVWFASAYRGTAEQTCARALRKYTYWEGEEGEGDGRSAVAGTAGYQRRRTAVA
jgi:hypothetical protein